MKKVYKAVGMLMLSAILMTGCKGDAKRYEFREQGIEQLNSGNYEEAIKSFEQALENSKGFVGTFELDVLKYRAEAEYNVEDYGAAAHTYGILMQVEEMKPEYLNMQCMLYIKAGDLEQALETYRASYEMDSKTSAAEAALLTLGEALTQANWFDEAMILYQQAIDDGLQSSELYNRMGLCEMEAGNYDQALVYFEQGVLIGDDDILPKLLYNRAAVYEQKLEFEKALELLQSYASTYGTTPEIEKEIRFLETR